MNTWTKAKLGDVISYRKGYAFKSSNFIAAGIPVIRISDTTRTSVKDNLSAYVEPEYGKSLKDFELKEKDVVLTTVGSRPPMYDSMVGKAISIHKKNAGSLLNQNMVILRGVPYTLEQDYLAINLRTKRFVYFIETLIRGNANQVSIALKELFKYKFLLPPFPEQKAIADLLSTWDEAIGKTERLIQAKETRFKWLLRELISEPPNTQKDAKWRKVKLGEIGEISSAGVDKKINHNEVSVRLLNYLDVYRRDFVYSRELTHEVTAPKTKATKCDIRKGDVFFTPSSEVRDDVAHSAVAMEDIPNGVYSYHIVRLRLHENIDLLYRAYAFKSSGFYKQAYKYCNGSGQRYVISQSNFRKIAILLPPLETQRKIAETLYSAQQEINLLEQLADKYKTQKRGLMQKMLTGEWRVKPEIVKTFVE